MAAIERGSVGERMSGWVKHGGVVYTSGQVPLAPRANCHACADVALTPF
jgi:enamine deaminase RidA (YjgF/YER057c/UK114 family)